MIGSRLFNSLEPKFIVRSVYFAWKMKNLVILIFCITFPWLVVEGHADGPEVETGLQYLSDNLMSPYCPGLTISSCPSPQAGELREEMRGMLKAGYSVEAVRNQLKMRFGDKILGAPRAQGIGLLIWIIPAFFVLLGFLVIGVFLRRRTVGTTNKESATVILDARVESELRRRLLGE